MSLALVRTRALVGVDAPEVYVEVHLANGLPTFNMVGLPETAVKESRDRVRSAIVNNGFEFPAKRITVSLAPADLPKEGGRFDLAIALGILAASGQIPQNVLKSWECLGELSLSGELRPVRGVLSAALSAREAGRWLVLPKENADEASMATGVSLIAASHLLEVMAYLKGEIEATEFMASPQALPVNNYPDLCEVQGQEAAKRALCLAAAGQHNLLMCGPPGTGKSLLASRLPGLMPPLTEGEALEVAAIQSVVSYEPLRTWPLRPFRQPHHSASASALVGGGSKPKPGEISLAHSGILFLDELPEFNRNVLEVLREPMESGEIVIARAHSKIRFPARFQLVAAMNPCPCGYHDDPSGRCRCTPDQIQRYTQKLSGPLLDRIDMHIRVAREPTKLQEASTPQNSKHWAQKVALTHQIQLSRQGISNARLDLNGLKQHAVLQDVDRVWLEHASESLKLSLRAVHRVIKVARTIADWASEDSITRQHLAEALQYRPKI